MVTEADADLFLVRLEGRPRALNLTHQRMLDTLGLDDRVSTGRLDDAGPGEDPLLSVSQRLSDAIFDWWHAAPPPVVYRTRSVPASRSIAFSRGVEWETLAARPLPEAVGLLVALVTRHGFTVPGHWLG